MRTIVNRSGRPLRVPLVGGKTLHLGPAKTGEISDPTAESPAFRKLVDAGMIEVVGEAGHGTDRESGSSAPHAEAHGHPQPNVVRPKGNR